MNDRQILLSDNLARAHALLRAFHASVVEGRRPTHAEHVDFLDAVECIERAQEVLARSGQTS